MLPTGSEHHAWPDDMEIVQQCGRMAGPAQAGLNRELCRTQPQRSDWKTTGLAGREAPSQEDRRTQTLPQKNHGRGTVQRITTTQEGRSSLLIRDIQPRGAARLRAMPRVPRAGSVTTAPSLQPQLCEEGRIRSLHLHVEEYGQAEGREARARNGRSKSSTRGLRYSRRHPLRL